MSARITTGHVVVAALLASSVIATPALAAQPSASPAAQASVTLALRPNLPALHALAHRRGLTGAQRRAGVAAVQSSAAARGAVEAYLRNRGLAVTGSTPTSVTATGAANAVASSFSHGVPTPLASAVAAVATSSDRHHWRRRDVPFGMTSADLRSAYQAAGNAQGDGATVATIQFSGWDSHLLSQYAANAGLPSPVINAVSVDGSSTSVESDPDSGFEVALDQEALLAAAPKARQLVYVANNTDQGALQVWARIVDDVAHGRVHLTAVSTSWGDCEPNIVRQSPPGQMQAIDGYIQQLVAMDVTVFASSGDGGALDCDPSGPLAGVVSVDFPASSPSAVAVGGTTMTGSRQSGWTETGWYTPADPQSSTSQSGSGGGVSTVFGRPGYQSGLLPDKPARRLVPDISSDGDPDTGFAVWDPEDPSGPWVGAGGTSFGAPVQAGLYAASRVARHPSTALGDIHAALYSHGGDGSFRDVTSGGDPKQSDAQSNPSNGGAHSGYDLVTGVGSPQWTTLARHLVPFAVYAPAATSSTTVPVQVDADVPVDSWAVGEQGTVDCNSPSGPPPSSIQIAPGDRSTAIVAAAHYGSSCTIVSTPLTLDTHAPSAAAGLSRLTNGDTRLRLTWGGSDPQPASGIASYAVTLRRTTPTTRAVTVWSHTVDVPGSAIFTGQQGATYQLYVTTRDAAGNPSAQAVSPQAIVPIDDGWWRHSAGWHTVAAAHAFGARMIYADGPGATITRTTTVKTVWLLAAPGPTSGLVAVYVDGKFRHLIDLYRPQQAFGVAVLLGNWAQTGQHTITLKVLHQHRRGALGTRAYVDGVFVR